MNKIAKVLGLCGVLCLSVACSDDFFEYKPTGELDSSMMNAGLAGSLRNSAYAYIGANMSGYSAPFMDGYADNGYSRNAWDSNGASVQSNSLTPSQNYGYDWAYGGIRKCNLLIESLVGSPLSQTIIDKYTNEARVIRAWLYADLTLRFGDVIHITKVADDYPDGLERTAASTIRTWVLSELTEAAAALPTSNDKGYLNRAQATAVLARYAYYFGEYAQAETAAKYVIDNGGYSLHTVSSLTAAQQADAAYIKQLVDFTSAGISEDAFIKGIFSYMGIWKADGSPEVILAKEYIPTAEKGNYLRVTALMSPNQVDKQAWATIVPIQQLVDAYWAVDGKTKPTLTDRTVREGQFKTLQASITQAAATAGVSKSAYVASTLSTVVADQYMDQYRNRDARLYASVVFPFSAINEFVPGAYQIYEQDIVNYGRSGFTFRKMTGADDVAPLWGGGYYGTGVDFPIIRLAEMYLVLAEAHTQTTGYDATAVAALNKLRTRLGMPEVPTGLAKNDALDFIRRERRLELAGEGLRFFDIRLYEDDTRNGGYKGTEAASSVMTGQIFDVLGTPGAKLTWATRLNLLPLPTSAVDKNPKLQGNNNPGY